MRLRSLILRIQIPAILVSTIVLGLLGYQRLSDVILQGFDRKLAALSTSCSVFMKGEDMERMLREKDAMKSQGLDPEQQPLYLHYILPMRAIMDRADLTFAYTQILKHEDRGLYYVLDATMGVNHSPLGMEDKVPAEDWDGALRVMTSGEVYLTGIRYWDVWGMLKCGWAPIYGADGSIKAMSGADVNIDIIRKKVRIALLKTVGAGLFAMVLAGLSSLFISQKLTKPLDEIREASLRVAAGQYDWRSKVAQPKELARLSSTLNQVAEASQYQIRQQQLQLQHWQRERSRHLLEQKLQSTDLFLESLSCTVAAPTDPSGYCLYQQWVLIWLAKPRLSAIENIRFSHTIKCLAERLFPQKKGRILAFMRSFFPEEIDCLLLFDQRQATLSAFVRTPPYTLRRSIAGFEEIQLKTGERLALHRKELLFIFRSAGAGAVETAPNLPATSAVIRAWMNSHASGTPRFAVLLGTPESDNQGVQSPAGGEE